MDHKKLNNLAAELAKRLHDTTEEYCMQIIKDELPIGTLVAGASNLYMASACMNAGSREDAFEVLRQCMEIVHDLIQNTPDAWFNLRQRPDLN